MRILFCNIASMKYYRGITENDAPSFGGSYISETGDAHEKYNFLPFVRDGKEVCFGFVETKATVKGKRNQLHIERLFGRGEATSTYQETKLTLTNRQFLWMMVDINQYAHNFDGRSAVIIDNPADLEQDIPADEFAAIVIHSKTLHTFAKRYIEVTALAAKEDEIFYSDLYQGFLKTIVDTYSRSDG